VANLAFQHLFRRRIEGQPETVEEMHGLVCDVSQALGLRALRLEALGNDSDENGPSHLPRWWPAEWTEEALRLMTARSQSLHDNTRGFTRSLGW
jgi:hypothetical protein